MNASFLPAADAIATWRDDVLSGNKPPCWSVGDGFECIELGPGMVVLLGGAPGAGKTALAMQWVLDALRIDDTLRVLVANVESSPAVLLDRQLSRLSGFPLNLIRDRAIDESHGERLADAFDVLDAVADRLTFLQSPFSLPNVAAAADATDSKLIVIDYAQRFDAGSGEKRHQVNQLMDYLRRFADADCGLLVLAAVGRTKDKAGRSSYDPNGLNLASFRESSELEFGADAAYMLCPDGPGKAKLACLKNRHGEPVGVDMEWDGSVQRFTPPVFDTSPEELWGLPAGGDSIG